jgi:hypothetical protein
MVVFVFPMFCFRLHLCIQLNVLFLLQLYHNAKNCLRFALNKQGIPDISAVELVGFYAILFASVAKLENGSLAPACHSWLGVPVA